MSSYFAIQFFLSGSGGRITALRRAFGHRLFRPAALGGIEHHAKGSHWFLAGKTLEEFVHRFAGSVEGEPASVRIAATDEKEREYLAEMTERLRNKAAPANRLSPYEHLDEQAGISYLDPGGLSEDQWLALDEWLDEYPKAIVYIYGGVTLRSGPDAPTAQQLFRTWESAGPGDAILRVRWGPAPGRIDEYDLSLSTASTLWLQEGVDAVGHEGEHLLTELVGLAGAIRREAGDGFQGAELLTEGSRFHNHNVRLQKEFGSILHTPI